MNWDNNNGEFDQLDWISRLWVHFVASYYFRITLKNEYLLDYGPLKLFEKNIISATESKRESSVEFKLCSTDISDSCK